MMIKFVFSLLLTVCSLSALLAQEPSNKVLMTIDGKEVTLDEFERIYTKNNQQPAYDKASLDEYMQLFINFKLKVMEAEALGMDTLQSFITELKGYRSQLEKPYFTDETADEELINEAYERMKWNIRASHILIKCGEDALPADTLAAWNEISKIRKRALKGEDFGQLVVSNSQDPSAERNKGDLGYFTAFSMVYPFESGAYNTPVGEISEIVRSKFGYHIIKVVDKKPDPGQVKVAHLMRAVPQGSGVEKDQAEKEKIDALYDSIVAGANFDRMVRQYSDDRGTSQKGGELPFFGLRQMVPEFEQAAFELKEIGQVSKPIKTAYGWHIIKLLETKPVGTFEEVKPTIKNKMSKDIRAQKGKQRVMARLKQEYQVKTDPNAMELFYQLIDSTIYKGQWDGNKANGLNQVMFTIADTNKYTQMDFAMSMNMDGLRRVNKPLRLIADEEFNRFLEQSLTNFERTRLEAKYPDFKNLMQEYHDGILLFNLTDKLVWTKAVEDTLGLEKFYQENKNNYMWGNRVDATIYTFNKKEMESKVSKLAAKVAKKNLDPSKEVAQLIANAKDTTLTLTANRAKFSKGDNTWVDASEWKAGTIYKTDNNGSTVLVYFHAMVAPEPKKLNEAKGLITADYQNYLEKNWLASLREKYKIDIHQEVFDSIVK
ncbi:MAG: peptidylprolyl isomerase [Salinivirgaceae bacterium]|nr:peptidylprolyl isomerase [Salinivirgaceae bacterium]